MRQYTASGTVTTLADVCELDVSNEERLSLDITVGVASLSAFELHYRTSPQGNYFKFASAAADFTAPTGLIVGCIKDDGTAVDLTTAASGTKASLIIDVRGLESLKIRAAGTASTVAVIGGAQ